MKSSRENRLNSYTQKLSTSIHKLWDTLKITLKLERYLTASVRCHRLKRAAVADSSLERMHLWPLVCLMAAVLTTQTIPAHAVGKQTEIDHLKLYAHSRIINWKEFQCFNKIITQESRWSIHAHNGSHWGLGQMRNERYKRLDGYSQIDWSLRYIADRYHTPCKALQFMKRNGYH